MGLNIEQFIKDTIKMPAFRPVFQGEEERSYILVPGCMVGIWGIANFSFAMKRINAILLHAGFQCWIDAPKVSDTSYKMHLVNSNWGNNEIENEK